MTPPECLSPRMTDKRLSPRWRQLDTREIASKALHRRAAWEARQRAFEPDDGPKADSLAEAAADSLVEAAADPWCTPSRGLRRVSSLCCSPANSIASGLDGVLDGVLTPPKLRRSLSLPTKSAMRRAARRLASGVTAKVQRTARAQEQLLYWLYKTRETRRRGSWSSFTDPLAGWRLYWRWAGIVLLLVNASLLLLAGWHRHRREAAGWHQHVPIAPSERLVSPSGTLVQAFSLAEMLLGLCTAAGVGGLRAQGYRRGYGGWLLTLDAWLVFDCAVDLEIWRYLWTDVAGRNLHLPRSDALEPPTRLEERRNLQLPRSTGAVRMGGDAQGSLQGWIHGSVQGWVPATARGWVHGSGLGWVHGWGLGWGRRQQKGAEEVWRGAEGGWRGVEAMWEDMWRDVERWWVEEGWGSFERWWGERAREGARWWAEWWSDRQRELREQTLVRAVL